MNLLSAPLELSGDWGVSSPEDALIVLSRAREVCLDGIRLLSPDQPAELRVESRSSVSPYIWLESSTRAHIVVDGTARDWPRMAYQFGHELGHVLSNSWQPDALPLWPTQWVEEALVEAFTLRGLALIADSWERDPWLDGEGDFSKHLRRYREFLIGRYRNGATQSKPWLNGWFADSRKALESGLGGRPATGPALLMILGELGRDNSCVEDLTALNRWHTRTAIPLEEYLVIWRDSCAELGTPGRMPRRLGELLFPDENPRPSLRSPEPFIRRPRRGEIHQQIAAIDDLVPLDHPVRAVWAFAEGLDLHDVVPDPEAPPGRVAPALMMALWLWASAEGVGSARQLERRCATEVSYRWLCGGVEINSQTLAEFRLLRADALDRLLAHSLAALVDQRVFDVDFVPPAAPKARKLLGACFEGLVDRSAARIVALRGALDRDDPVADERHSRAARGRAARRQGERVQAALKRLKDPLQSGQEA